MSQFITGNSKTAKAFSEQNSGGHLKKNMDLGMVPIPLINFFYIGVDK